MSTIPTLIVAPAILAAGLTYKYTGGDDNISGVRTRRYSESKLDSDNSDSRRQSQTQQRRMSVTAGSSRPAGSHFESDFAPKVPSDMNRADAFVPTTMLGSSSVVASTNASPSTVSHRRTLSESATYSPWKQILQSNLANVPTEHNSTYPNTTHDINRSSWFYRMAHKITGDLGPIEHQEDYLDKHPAGTQSEVPAWDHGVFRGPMFGTSSVHKSAKDTGNANIHVATRAAEDVTYRGVKGTRDANEAANKAVARNDAERERRASEGGRGWFSFLSKKTDDAASDVADSAKRRASNISDSAKQAADDTRGWFWGKKQEAEDAASDAARNIKRRASDVSDSAKQAADDTRGWFWNKKQDAEDAVDSAKRSAKETKRTVEDKADETRGWFWNKKQEADETASNVAHDIKQRASEAADTAKQTVDNTIDSAKRSARETKDAVKDTADSARGWFWDKKQDADEAASNAARDIKRRASDMSDSAKQAADDTRGWFWGKKHEADKAASNAADSIKQTAEDAKDVVDTNLRYTRESIGQAADNAQDWMAAKKDQVQDAAADMRDSAKSAMGDARDWAADKADQARSSMDDACDSVSSTMSDARDWAADKSDQAKSSVSDTIGRSADASREWANRTRSQIDQSVANAAESVRDTAQSASNSAQRAADSANSSYWQRTHAAQSPGSSWDIGGYNMDSPVAGEKLEQQQQRLGRRDSVIGSSDNSVLSALDDKFNEARETLRNTSDELKTMASDAGSRASEKLRNAAEIARPHPTNEGLIVNETEYSPAYGVRDRLRFVEIDSGIPTLSSTTTASRE